MKIYAHRIYKLHFFSTSLMNFVIFIFAVLIHYAFAVESFGKKIEKNCDLFKILVPLVESAHHLFLKLDYSLKFENLEHRNKLDSKKYEAKLIETQNAILNILPSVLPEKFDTFCESIKNSDIDIVEVSALKKEQEFIDLADEIAIVLEQNQCPRMVREAQKSLNEMVKEFKDKSFFSLLIEVYQIWISENCEGIQDFGFKIQIPKFLSCQDEVQMEVMQQTESEDLDNNQVNDESLPLEMNQGRPKRSRSQQVQYEELSMDDEPETRDSRSEKKSKNQRKKILKETSEGARKNPRRSKSSSQHADMVMDDTIQSYDDEVFSQQVNVFEQLETSTNQASRQDSTVAMENSGEAQGDKNFNEDDYESYIPATIQDLNSKRASG